ncbi:MAG: type II secretion system protein GspL [Magnetococcales bacterium]|nr:type II secretion system protein GspL [Magnetococcales bacterium]
MASPVFLFLPRAGGEHFTLVDPERGAGNRVSLEPMGALDRKAVAIKGRKVVAVAPGTDLLLTRVRMPKTSRANLEKAVPFQLEEQLASPVEKLHFAVENRSSDGFWPVAVVARELLSGWMTLLKQAGIHPDVMACEPLLVPFEIGSWSVMVTPEMALVRTGEREGFAADPQNLEALLKLALTGESRPTHGAIRVVNHTGGDLALPDFTDTDISLTLEEGVGDFWERLAKGYSPGGGINLLQGLFSPSRQWQEVWRPFRLTLILLLGWLLLRGGVAVVDNQQLAQRIATLDERIKTIFLTTFPDAKRVVNAKVQMNQRLAELRKGGQEGGNGGDFLSLLEGLGPLIGDVSGATPYRLRYNKGEMDLHLRIPDLDKLDRLKGKLNQVQGMRVEIQSASQGEEGVESHLRIRGGGS